MSTPYRTPADLAAQMPRSPWSRARVAVALIIVAPVRFVRWAWPWLAATALLNGAFVAVWRDYPREMSIANFAINVAACVGWGLYLAYRWASRVLNERDTV